MNIDIEAFKKWFEEAHTNDTIGFHDKDDWYISYAGLLLFFLNDLEQFNRGNLAESA